MKKFAALLAFSTVLAFGATAKAADMVEAPAVYDWTGFYFGGNIGYGFGGSDDVGISATNGTHVAPGELQVNGIFGGAQIGADWQAGWAVFGAVADIEASDIKDDFDNSVTGGITSDASSDVNLWGTLRGRLGWAADRVLVYGTGGFAWGTVDYDVRTIDTGGNHAKMSDSSTLTGWTAGGGLAWAIDDNWSVGAEYLYVNLGKQSIHGTVFDDAGDPNGVRVKTEETPDFHTVKAFVNFKF
jgi:outer membrane immunogenic protein